jgi:hypothetical protein
VVSLNLSMRPKARGLGRIGVLPSLARDGTVMEQSLPTALEGLLSFLLLAIPAVGV